MLNMQPGTLQSVIKKPKLLIVPSNVTPWIPRDLDAYQII